ncbi:hypothetical protein AO464_08140 [Oenococcus oeni]|nr:hypothetical protein AO499_02595 [Oenococcus oeni]PDH87331.1 hypothetical protein AO464_08140 [Oenococcus oeni]PDH87932.1 hypothetical protein AO465_05605 [Oenococcus oeni]PDH89713.1 hypothetical protein AO463_01370 [Oenococcus oeni]PDH90901.1 hypothetical protein AO466_01555 [Oenococcus oeni]
MCGRFMFKPTDSPEIQRIYQLALDNGYQLKSGEIFPTDQTALIVAGKKQVRIVQMPWGFPGFKEKQIIINARAETIMNKEIFADAFIKYRCVYPTSGFFEWTKDKQKIYFNYQEKPSALYIAGFYNFFDGQAKSILITTVPNASVAPIHNRMPLILKKEEINRWIYDSNFAKNLLAKQMPLLTAKKV